MKVGLMLLPFFLFLAGCENYYITSTHADHDEVKRIWEYCQKCLSDKECRHREECKESNTMEDLKFTMDLAISTEKNDTVRYFIEVIGLDINAVLDESNGETALHICSYYNSPRQHEICRYLVSKGADVNAILDTNARTPLLLSIKRHNNENAKFLLEHGADISITTQSGQSVCWWSYVVKNWEIMPYIPNCCKEIIDSPSLWPPEPGDFFPTCQKIGK